MHLRKIFCATLLGIRTSREYGGVVDVAQIIRIFQMMTRTQRYWDRDIWTAILKGRHGTKAPRNLELQLYE